jgi:hypothetical protein
MASLARPRRLVRRPAFLAALVLVAALCAASPLISRVHPARPAPVRVVVTVPAPEPGDDGCGGGAHGLAYHLVAAGAAGRAAGTAWIAPSSGDYRISQAGRTQLRCGSTLVRVSPGLTSLRQGLTPAFLGPAADPVVLDVVRAWLSPRPFTTAAGARLAVRATAVAPGVTRLVATLDGRRFLTATVDRTITVAEAGRLGLFTRGRRHAGTRVVERAVGEGPAYPARGYWLGRHLHALTARSAVQRRTPRIRAFTVYYEAPGAGGATSALPDTLAPAGELEVTSEPVASPRARSALALLRARGWPRRHVRLAGGERALLVPYRGPLRGRGFALRTRSTLVSVVGDVPSKDAAPLARALRRLPAAAARHG